MALERERDFYDAPRPALAPRHQRSAVLRDDATRAGQAKALAPHRAGRALKRDRGFTFLGIGCHQVGAAVRSHPALNDLYDRPGPIRVFFAADLNFDGRAVAAGPDRDGNHVH